MTENYEELPDIVQNDDKPEVEVDEIEEKARAILGYLTSFFEHNPQYPAPKYYTECLKKTQNYLSKTTNISESFFTSKNSAYQSVINSREKHNHAAIKMKKTLNDAAKFAEEYDRNTNDASVKSFYTAFDKLASYRRINDSTVTHSPEKIMKEVDRITKKIQLVRGRKDQANKRKRKRKQPKIEEPEGEEEEQEQEHVVLNEYDDLIPPSTTIAVPGIEQRLGRIEEVLKQGFARLEGKLDEIKTCGAEKYQVSAVFVRSQSEPITIQGVYVRSLKEAEKKCKALFGDDFIRVEIK